MENFKPAMADIEVEIINKIIEDIRPKICLEFGSGYSTIYWTNKFNFIEKWVSIEHDKTWYDRIFKLKNDKVELKLVNISPNYYNCVLEYNNKFDFILIDGKFFRLECMKIASKILSENGIAILHDCGRRIYDKGFKYFKNHKILYSGELPVSKNKYRHRGVAKLWN